MFKNIQNIMYNKSLREIPTVSFCKNLLLSSKNFKKLKFLTISIAMDAVTKRNTYIGENPYDYFVN